MSKIRFALIHLFILIFLLGACNGIILFCCPSKYFSGMNILILFFSIVNFLSALLYFSQPSNIDESVQKSFAFKIMMVRGFKFLSYLIIALIFILSVDRSYHNVLTIIIMSLFFVYTSFELYLHVKKIKE